MQQHERTGRVNCTTAVHCVYTPCCVWFIRCFIQYDYKNRYEKKGRKLTKNPLTLFHVLRSTVGVPLACMAVWLSSVLRYTRLDHVVGILACVCVRTYSAA